MSEQPEPPTRRQRWLARLAFAAAIVAVVVLLLPGGLKSITALLLGFAGLAVACAAAWWFLANRGIVRWLACVVLVAAPVFIIVVYVAAALLWEVALAFVLAAAAAAAGRAALSSGHASEGPPEYAAAQQQRPFLIMNPRSGGGKVGKFGLTDKATTLGAEVALLEGPGFVDVAALARQAADRGADLLGVAGGDGTQALVAGIAAARDIPMMVISAGTRNHFALDLGLDRDDPASCLDGLTDWRSRSRGPPAAPMLHDQAFHDYGNFAGAFGGKHDVPAAVETTGSNAGKRPGFSAAAPGSASTRWRQGAGPGQKGLGTAGCPLSPLTGDDGYDLSRRASGVNG